MTFKCKSMISGSQIRMARSALKWSASKLAEKCGLAERTIIRLEAKDGMPRSRTDTLSKIKIVFEKEGIEFLGAPDDAPGIRFHASKE